MEVTDQNNLLLAGTGRKGKRIQAGSAQGGLLFVAGLCL